MDALRRTRQMNRERSDRLLQARRGAKQIVIPMTREQYDVCWEDSLRTREFVDRTISQHPELFPPCLRNGFALHGFARPSRKLSGVRLRKIRPTGGGEAFHLRPSFVMSYYDRYGGRPGVSTAPAVLRTATVDRDHGVWA